MTERSFRFIHRFLNSRKDTPLGPGLGLPVSDSFFLFKSPDDPNEFTFFEGLSNRRTKWAGFLRDLVRTGVIDTLHTYGAFSSETDFSRDLAKRGVDTLHKNNMRIRVWVNHGPPPKVQCFGEPRSAHFFGDDPRSIFYHTDVTLRYGIEYCWTGNEPGEHLGNDSSRYLVGLRRAAGLLFRPRRVWQQLRLSSRLLRVMRLRDGQLVLGFKRYWGTAGQTPVVSDIVHQLSADRLSRLQRTGGTAVIYQHFGVRRKAPGFGVDSYVANQEPYFRPDECSAFNRIAEQYHNGNIFMTSTERLLTYNRMWSWLSWKAEDIDNRRRVVLLGLKMPGFPERLLERTEIEGLTFYSDRPHETDIFLKTGSGTAPVGAISRNAKDHTGRESVMVPLTSLDVPEV